MKVTVDVKNAQATEGTRRSDFRDGNSNLAVLLWPRHGNAAENPRKSRRNPTSSGIFRHRAEIPRERESQPLLHCTHIYYLYPVSFQIQINDTVIRCRVCIFRATFISCEGDWRDTAYKLKSACTMGWKITGIRNKDRRNSGYWSTFRIRVSGSEVVISGKFRVPKSASNWLKITELKAISTQKRHEVENSERPVEIRGARRIRPPNEWIEKWVPWNFIILLVIIGQNPSFSAFVVLRGVRASVIWPFSEKGFVKSGSGFRGQDGKIRPKFRRSLIRNTHGKWKWHTVYTSFVLYIYIYTKCTGAYNPVVREFNATTVNGKSCCWCPVGYRGEPCV